MIKTRLLVLALLGMASSCLPAAADEPAVISAPAGKLSGVAAGTLQVFKGIPYALPPTGSRRWKPPLPMPKWKGTRDAKVYGPACVQPKARGDSIYAWDIGALSEDCLTLNVWAPAKASRAPVFVWIHGGALSSGSGGEPMYDGSKLAERGLVVVTINYRMGILGFLAHPGLSAESRRNVSGNYGLLDQMSALRWVQDNISAFGGDAGNVTIAGESAGALSVMYLMVAPEARGLFHKAVAQSAYMISAPELRGVTYGGVAAEPVGPWLGEKLGAGDLAGMRSMDAVTLTTGAAAVGYFPFFNIDGRVLPRQVVEAFDRGEQAKVPILVGFNSGEIRSLRVLSSAVPADAATYEKEIRARYADLADAFLKLYPSSDMNESVLATTRDALYGWTSERLARKQTASGVPAYLYLFDHGYPAANDLGLHAFHASEIPYMFGTADKTPVRWPKVPATPVETQLSDAMLNYWSSFARDGVPSAAGQPAWPAYDGNRAYLAFENVPVAKTQLMPGMFEHFEQVVCRRRAKGGIPWNWNFGLASPPLPTEATCR
jgi:para-nitrobenzyl esterase